jgi:hypothetical protein
MFSAYLKAQVETKLARQMYETASLRIEVCSIKERVAGIKSQHEPLYLFTYRAHSREELIELIDYVVFGKELKCHL